jgi:hypothetical protein
MAKIDLFLSTPEKSRQWWEGAEGQQFQSFLRELSYTPEKTLHESTDMYKVCEARGELKVIKFLLELPIVIKEYQKGLKTTGPGGMTEMKKVG